MYLCSIMVFLLLMICSLTLTWFRCVGVDDGIGVRSHSVLWSLSLHGGRVAGPGVGRWSILILRVLYRAGAAQDFLCWPLRLDSGT